MFRDLGYPSSIYCVVPLLYCLFQLLRHGPHLRCLFRDLPYEIGSHIEGGQGRPAWTALLHGPAAGHSSE